MIYYRMTMPGFISLSLVCIDGLCHNLSKCLLCEIHDAIWYCSWCLSVSESKRDLPLWKSDLTYIFYQHPKSWFCQRGNHRQWSTKGQDKRRGRHWWLWWVYYGDVCGVYVVCCFICNWMCDGLCRGVWSIPTTPPTSAPEPKLPDSQT